MRIDTSAFEELYPDETQAIRRSVVEGFIEVINDLQIKKLSKMDELVVSNLLDDQRMEIIRMILNDSYNSLKKLLRGTLEACDE